MFLHCSIARHIWANFAADNLIALQRGTPSAIAVLMPWDQMCIAILWNSWKERNGMIFDYRRSLLGELKTVILRDIQLWASEI
jgi:hypothetical protein